MQKGLSNNYDPKIDASLPVSFFAAAFRFGHSLLPSTVEKWSVSHKHVCKFCNWSVMKEKRYIFHFSNSSASQRLSELFNRPFDIYQGGIADMYMSGFMNQVSQAVDDGMTEEVRHLLTQSPIFFVNSDFWFQLTNHLFPQPKQSFGTDLASLNMQRGRDHGVPSYNVYREFCGLRRARHWDDLVGSFTNETLQKYAKTYASPDDIDLWSAGISERPSLGSMVGPVFGCIIGETFKNLRYGDRFWYENGGLPNSFTLGKIFNFKKKNNIQ